MICAQVAHDMCTADEHRHGACVFPAVLAGHTATAGNSYSWRRRAADATAGPRHAGNYGAGLMALQAAKKAGFTDVVYLDAKTETCLEELSAANIFVVKVPLLLPFRSPLLPFCSTAPTRPAAQCATWRWSEPCYLGRCLPALALLLRLQSACTSSQIPRCC